MAKHLASYSVFGQTRMNATHSGQGIGAHPAQAAAVSGELARGKRQPQANRRRENTLSNAARRSTRDSDSRKHLGHKLPEPKKKRTAEASKCARNPFGELPTVDGGGKAKKARRELFIVTLSTCLKLPP